MTSFATYPSLTGRTAIVTGGASGIGEGFVRALAANGCRVGFLDLLEEAGGKLGEAIAGTGAPRPVFLRCDLTDTAALRAALAELERRLGPAAVLVANAADDTRHRFDEVSPETLLTSMAINFTQSFFACQEVSRQMRRIGGGSIVVMTSPASTAGAINLTPYAAGKAALIGLTTALARELGPDGIRVNAIAPGLVQTPRQGLWRSQDEAAQVVHEAQFIHQAVTPDHVARLMLFLAADDSNPMTKQVIYMDGGRRS